jgi:hypothetical protein
MTVRCAVGAMWGGWPGCGRTLEAGARGGAAGWGRTGDSGGRCEGEAGAAAAAGRAAGIGFPQLRQNLLSSGSTVRQYGQYMEDGLAPIIATGHGSVNEG